MIPRRTLTQTVGNPFVWVLLVIGAAGAFGAYRSYVDAYVARFTLQSTGGGIVSAGFEREQQLQATVQFAPTAFAAGLLTAAAGILVLALRWPRRMPLLNPFALLLVVIGGVVIASGVASYGYGRSVLRGDAVLPVDVTATGFAAIDFGGYFGPAMTAAGVVMIAGGIMAIAVTSGLPWRRQAGES